MTPVMAELLVKLRSLSTVPDCAAVVWTATWMVMVSFKWCAL